MILRTLRYMLPIDRKNVRYMVVRFRVVAYDIKKRKSDGEEIFYKHHTVEDCLSEDKLHEAGYGDLPLGSLHNVLVVKSVLRSLDRID